MADTSTSSLAQVNAHFIAAAIGIDCDHWHGHCYEIASEIVTRNVLRIPARAVYGAYWGPVDPTGFWKDRVGMPWQRHGWIIAQFPKGERIIDPTRFSFENVEPYLYIRPTDDPEVQDQYDEGANRVRMAMRRPAPEEAGPPITTFSDTPDDALAHIRTLLGKSPEHVIGETDMFWIANLTPDELQPWTVEIYTLLEQNDFQCWVPIDNWRMVIG